MFARVCWPPNVAAPNRPHGQCSERAQACFAGPPPTHAGSTLPRVPHLRTGWVHPHASGQHPFSPSKTRSVKRFVQIQSRVSRIVGLQFNVLLAQETAAGRLGPAHPWARTRARRNAGALPCPTPVARPRGSNPTARDVPFLCSLKTCRSLPPPRTRGRASLRHCCQELKWKPSRSAWDRPT
jgi:hypothetical protein